MRLRGCRFPRSRCHKLCLAGFIISVCFILYTLVGVHKDKCTEEDSLEILASLCHEYRREYVSGKLCNAICISRDIQFEKCVNYRQGKKIMIAQMSDKEDSRIVLKTKKMEIWDYDPIWYIVDTEKVFPKIESFYNTILNSFHYAFNVKISEYASKLGIQKAQVGAKFVQNVWNGMNFEEYINSDPQDLHQMSAMQSIYSLVQQDEYLTMQLFQVNRHIPQIKGTCGHVYAVEYSPPGKALSTEFLKSISGYRSLSWQERATVAVGLLDLLQSFETISEIHGSLHLCDIKNENFGVSEDGVVQAIDLDMAFVDEKMKEELAASNCTAHKDCDFFDCWGWCDFKSKRCTSIRRNNNFQAVCQKVLLSGVSNGMYGLLKNPPKILRSDLDRILDECSAPTHRNEESTKFIASTNTLVQLRDLLKGSIVLEQ